MFRMSGSTSVFRSGTSRGSVSSGARPGHRSRSLGAASTPRRQNESVDHMSRIRDHDLKKDIDAKVVTNL